QWMQHRWSPGSLQLGVPFFSPPFVLYILIQVVSYKLFGRLDLSNDLLSKEKRGKQKVVQVDKILDIVAIRHSPAARVIAHSNRSFV
ncbi:MAG: hypothetical protein WBA22_15835, partial [Candidatus Methanofastidiosia archaeon]